MIDMTIKGIKIDENAARADINRINQAIPELKLHVLP